MISYSDTRAQLEKVMDRVVADHSPVVVSRQKGESVVIISLADWNALEETTHLLASTKNAQRLEAAIGQLESGKGRPRDLAAL